MPSVSLLVQGSTIQISTTEITDLTPSPAPTFASLECLGRDLTWNGGTSPEIDTTVICSTAKEFKLGLDDPGTITLNGHWKQGEAGHTAIRTANSDKLARLLIVTFEDTSTFSAICYVQSRSFSMSVDGVVTASYTFKLTGPTLESDA